MKISRFTHAKSTLLLVALSLVCAVANAKRRAPREVPPIAYQGINYSAPHWGAFSGHTQNGQYIQARSAETDKLLWELRVYEVKYVPMLEGDVQDIFITSLKIIEGNLEVVNEAGDTFVVDLSKRKVIKSANRLYEGKPRESERMHNVAIVVLCLTATMAAGSLLAGFCALLALDDEDLKRLEEKVAEATRLGRWAAYWTARREALPLSMIIAHWRTRPEVRRWMWIGLVFGLVAFITARLT